MTRKTPDTIPYHRLGPGHFATAGEIDGFRFQVRVRKLRPGAEVHVSVQRPYGQPPVEGYSTADTRNGALRRGVALAERLAGEQRALARLTDKARTPENPAPWLEESTDLIPVDPYRHLKVAMVFALGLLGFGCALVGSAALMGLLQ